MESDLNRSPFVKLAVVALFMAFSYNAVFSRSVQTDYLEAAREMLGQRDMPSMGDFADEVKGTVDAKFEEALKGIFDELDANKDGVIEFSEFKGMGLNTWATFRAIDLMVKSKLTTLPSFAEMRQTVTENMPKMPEELQFTNDRHWWASFRSAVWWYILVLFYVQCSLCAWENILSFLGLTSFTYPKRPDPKTVPVTDKVTCLQYDTPLEGWYEVIKMIIMSCSGLPILRMFQAVGFVAFGMIAVNISVMVPNKYWKGFWLRGVCRLCISGTLFSFGFYRVGIEGRVADKTDCKILVGNHTAVLEILIMFGLSFPSFISAVENARVPLFSGVVRACDAILVDRMDKNSRKHTMHEIKKRAKDPNAPQLMVYPEGTLNNQKGLFTFKPGAFESGQPVQPICFKFPYKHYNPCWTGEATGGNDVGEYLYRLLCQVVNRVEVKILSVYHPSEEEKHNKIVFANNVRNLMAAYLVTGVSDCVYEDYVALNKVYSRQKRLESRTANINRRASEFWFPFVRKSRAKVSNLLNSSLSDDDGCSVTSCDEKIPGNSPAKK